MPRKRYKIAAALVLALALAVAWVLPAAATTDLEARIKALESQLGQMKTELSRQKEEQARQAVAVKAATGKLPGWIKRMKLYGDMRMRFDHTTYDDRNGVSRDDRSRFRVRLRVGVKSQIHPDVEIGFRMVLGADDDPTSTNQTFDGYFAEFTSWGIDRAYVKWQPGFVMDRMITVIFGKHKLPYFSSKAMWDGDVVPEGAWINLMVNKKGQVQGFATVGVMFVEEHGSDPPDDIYALAIQLGIVAKIKPMKFTLAIAYYDWGDLGEAGNLPPNIHGNPRFTSGGATVLSEFGVFDVVVRFDTKLPNKMKLSFWGHYLTNTDASGPNDSEDTGWLGGGKISMGPFWFSAWYKYIEANASPGFIADSDSGFVNRKGYSLQVGWQIWKRGKLQVTWFDTEPIDGNLDGASNGSQTLFIETIFKF